MEGDKTKDMNPLKLAIPLALISLAGLVFLSIFKSPDPDEEHHMISSEDISEDELEEGNRSITLQESTSSSDQNEFQPEIVLVQSSDIEFPVDEFVNTINLEEEIESLKSLAISLQDRQCVFEEQVYNYCNMKEVESSDQKLQIMGLGLKVELLESENRRLECEIANCQEAIQDIHSIREELKVLHRKLKKLSRRSRQYSKFIRHGEEVLSKFINEFRHRIIEELQNKSKLIQDKMEDLSQFEVDTETKLLAHAEETRQHLFTDIEEMIYLGWINACLRDEILKNEKQQLLAANPSRPVMEVRDELVVQLPVEYEVMNCSVSLYDSDGSSFVDAEYEEDCIDYHIADAARERNGVWKKSGFFRKLKGWGKENRRCKKDQ